MVKKICIKTILITLLVTMVFTSCMTNKEKTKKIQQQDVNAVVLQMRMPESFNPLAATNHSVRDVFSLCYEPLFEIGEDLNVQGVLAENIQISEDCMSAVVTLKDDVIWHDGVKLTSADVVHTVNLLKENTSWEYYQCVKNIESIQTVDPLSFVISLSRPYGQITYSLTFPIVAAHNSEIDEKIMGTGAYCLDKYNPATMIELKSFEQWHGGMANCKRVNINIIRDVQTATTSFNTGLISAITSESFDSENNVPKANTQITSYNSNEFEFLAFNHKNSLFASQNVRNAISSATDRSSIAKDCYSANAIAANSPIHPIAQDASAASISSLYSLANASELLFLEGFVLDESSGVLKNSSGKEFTFELLVNSENQMRVNSAKLLREQLFAAGINVTVKEVSFDEYVKRIENGEFDAYLGGTRLLNLYDFEFILSEEGSLNNFGYLSEDMMTALGALSVASGEDSLESAVLNFEEVFSREQPICGLVFRTKTLMTAENIKGSITPQVNNPYKNLHEWTVGK